MRAFRWVGLAIIAFAVAFLPVACGNPPGQTSGGSGKSEDPPADEKAQAAKVKEPDAAKKEEKPDENPNPIETSAQVYLEDYEGNEVASDVHFKDKYLQITGYIHTVRPDPYPIKGDAREWNIVEIAGKPNGFRTIRCYVEKKYDVTQLYKGQKVTVVGWGAGKERIGPSRAFPNDR